MAPDAYQPDLRMGRCGQSQQEGPSFKVLSSHLFASAAMSNEYRDSWRESDMSLFSELCLLSLASRGRHISLPSITRATRMLPRIIHLGVIKVFNTGHSSSTRRDSTEM